MKTPAASSTPAPPHSPRDVENVEKASSSPSHPTSWWQRQSRLRKILIIAIPLIMLVSLALGLGLGLGLSSASPVADPNAAYTRAPAPQATPTSSAAIVKPTIGMKWDYPLGYTLTASTRDPKVKFYGLDLVNTAQSDITALKNAGVYVACYFSGGSVEDYRTDKKDFPTVAIGKALVGYPDEHWLDIRNAQVKRVLKKRIDLAKTKGCQGVDVDNIDGYGNDSGFPLTQADTVTFTRELATYSHGIGLAYGLKNGGDVVPKVVDIVDWEINEECVANEECAQLKPIVDAKKPVFHVEYIEDNQSSVPADLFADTCAAEGQKGFSSIVKRYKLDKFIKSCA